MGIPLWIAGGGEKMTLAHRREIRAVHQLHPEPDGFAHKSEVLAQHCRDVGTDFDAIVRSVNVNADRRHSDADVKDRLQRIRDRMVGYVPEAAADAMLGGTSGPESAAGTPEQVIERLHKLRDLGCEYAICYFPEAAYDRSGIELFEREVIPALSRVSLRLGRRPVRRMRFPLHRNAVVRSSAALFRVRRRITRCRRHSRPRSRPGLTTTRS